MKEKKWYDKYDFLLDFGIIATALYIAAVVYFKPLIFTELKALSLNNLGDFCAGVFGPLMFLWLILGYLQQQKELKQNTKALMLQARELKNSVEQHKELVKAAYLQVDTEHQKLQMNKDREFRETQPDISIINAGLNSTSNEICSYLITIRNSGKDAFQLCFTFDPMLEEFANRPPLDFLKAGSPQELSWKTRKGRAPKDLKLIIDYEGVKHEDLQKTFVLKLEGEQYKWYTLTG